MRSFCYILTILSFAGCLCAQDLTLAIKSQDGEGSKGQITASFTNNGKNEIGILRPLDGSMWRWHMPYYDFSVFDSQGDPVKIGGRCGHSGLWANTKWPDDYLVVLRPGTSWSVDLHLPFEIPENDNYHVTLSYIYESTTGRKKLNMPYPEGLWVGVLKSNLIKLPRKRDEP